MEVYASITSGFLDSIVLMCGIAAKLIVNVRWTMDGVEKFAILR